MTLSSRSDVSPFIVMDVLARARRLEAEGHRIVHMEIGQPGTPAPEGARRAAAEALGSGSLGYTEALGLPSLRRAISDLYRRRYGIEVPPARIVVTNGASGGFILAFTALFEAGDGVALGAPGYPSYRQILRALSLRPLDIETSAEDRYQPRPDAIPAEAKGLIVASPANPTGTILGRDDMEALADAAREAGAAFVSDEIYHGLDYGGRAVSALEIDDDAWVINSFSKYHSMTGWRIGWMVVPEAHVRSVERLAQNLFICAPHVSQVAAEAALGCEAECEANRAVYAANREMLLSKLPAIGFDRIAPPDGAFYIYADVSQLTDDSLAFAARILDEAGVALAPGPDFDPHRGKHTLRFSYAASTPDIAEGLRQLEDFMARG